MSETDFPSADDPQFDQYMEALAKAINYGQHQELLRGYCAGLIGPGERKSMEPIAARLAPENASAMHQRVHHFVADGAWSDEAVLAAVREQVLAAMLRHGPIRFWIVDDTGIRKKGKESVGVARQYCGEVGKIDNCQVLVSLSVANDVACLPVAARLYLPEAWAEDETRRAKVGVPLDVTFQTKPEIALDQIRRMHTAGVAPGIVLADEAYGRSAAFRQGIAALDMTYAVAVPSSLLVGPPAYKRLPRFWQSAAGTASLRTLAGLLPQTAFRTVTWREGSRSNLTSRFALLRVRVAPSGDAEDGAEDEQNGAEDEQSLLIEWPDDEKDPSGYWLVTLPARVSIEKIVEIEGSLVDRAGLPRPQAGGGPRRLRRPRLARLPSPCHSLDRRLRLPPHPALPSPAARRRSGRPAQLSSQSDTRKTSTTSGKARPVVDRYAKTQSDRRSCPHPPAMSMLPRQLP